MSDVLLADSHLARTQAGQLIQVAVGILFDTHNRFLMTSRPSGKVYAGYWEFPGGKLEAGESVAEGLCRELMEELSLIVATQQVQVWRTQVVDYPHALVELHFCKIYQWSGKLVLNEGQNAHWCTLPVSLSPILPGALPVLNWLKTSSNGLNNKP